jgi:hypothetical protein
VKPRGTPRTPRQHRVGVLGGTRGIRRPATGAGRSTARKKGDTNLPPKSRDLYQLLPRLKLLVLRICVLLVYRPNTELLLTLLKFSKALGDHKRRSMT